MELTDDTLPQSIETERVLLVDLWAPWCGPCRAMSPVLDELESDFKGRVAVAKLNVDDNPNTVVKYLVTSIPCLMVFKEGKLIYQWSGTHSKEEIAATLNTL